MNRTEVIERAVATMEGWFTCSDVAAVLMGNPQFTEDLARTNTRLCMTTVISTRLRRMAKRGELETRPRGYTPHYDYRRPGRR